MCTIVKVSTVSFSSPLSLWKLHQYLMKLPWLEKQYVLVSTSFWGIEGQLTTAAFCFQCHGLKIKEPIPKLYWSLARILNWSRNNQVPTQTADKSQWVEGAAIVEGLTGTKLHSLKVKKVFFSHNSTKQTSHEFTLDVVPSSEVMPNNSYVQKLASTR